MKQLSVLEKNGRVEQLLGELQRTDDDVYQSKTIHGRLDLPKENLVKLLGPSLRGDLEVSVDGHAYLLTNLTADGRFDAVPKSV
jgi:hypothetical protein